MSVCAADDFQDGPLLDTDSAFSDVFSTSSLDLLGDRRWLAADACSTIQYGSYPDCYYYPAGKTNYKIQYNACVAPVQCNYISNISCGFVPLSVCGPFSRVSASIRGNA